ncbi:extracellular solute-binding protein [Paenibacillus oceani]|uniref:Extracellular solute-binding protein n=1 Tax=Paenibacillus oceani TaxID=2772510 RepID=A0A927CH49_9BACL|nr:extracellular solute-binding protein [Paenibacillus oceani]MBD2865841.1 extracellular solute-binding protein [Paenibacillus oceani]
MKLRKTLVVHSLLATVLAAGCSSGQTGQKGSAGGADSKAKEPEKAPVVKVFMSGGLKFPDGQTINENPWTAMLEKETNVDLEIEYGPATPDDFISKLNLKFASGDIPDFFVLPATSQSWLMDNAKQGALMDLGDKVKNYKNLSNAVFPDAWEAAKYNGKIYAVPVLNDGNLGTNNFYVRKDWLDKLKLDVPKTLDDFHNVAKAFKEQDPDGNGKLDTYGFIGYDNLKGWSGLFGAFGVIPDEWIIKDGKIVQADIQPEMKDALAYIRKLHADKLLDNEWPLTKVKAYTEKVSNNKVGLYEGNWAAARNEINTSKTNDPAANWIAIDPPTGPTGKKGVFGDPAYKSFAVITSKAKHPEAILNMLDWLSVQNNIDKFVFGFGEYGENFMYTKKDGKLALNFENHNKYGYRQQLMFMQPKELNSGKMESLGADFKLVDNINLSVKNAIRDQFTGSPTPGMIENLSSLRKLRDETFVKIIIGELPLEAFDKFVTDYKAKGGDKILKEVEEWYAKKGK